MPVDNVKYFKFLRKFLLFSGAQLAPGEQMLSFVPVLLYRLIICDFNFLYYPIMEQIINHVLYRILHKRQV
jgi:hypothetical protein